MGTPSEQGQVHQRSGRSLFAAHATHAGTYSYYFHASGSGPIGCVCLAWAWPYLAGDRLLMLRTICKSSQTAEKRVARGRMRKVAAVPDSYASDAVVASGRWRKITYHAVILRLTALLVFFLSSILRFTWLGSQHMDTASPPDGRQASMSQRTIHW